MGKRNAAFARVAPQPRSSPSLDVMVRHIHADTADTGTTVSNRLACNNTHHAVILARSRTALQFHARRSQSPPIVI
jgi:hypothetical protein